MRALVLTFLIGLSVGPKIWADSVSAQEGAADLSSESGSTTWSKDSLTDNRSKARRLVDGLLGPEKSESSGSPEAVSPDSEAVKSIAK